MNYRLRDFRAEKVPAPRSEPDLVVAAASSQGFDLEIGCGAGLHAIRYARQNPERFLVAIERTQQKFEAFASRLRGHGEMSNLLALRDDAVSVVTHLVAPKSVDRIFLLYPNPYPKAAQANKRWHRMPFLLKLHEVLRPGGEIRLATNESFYKDEASKWMRGLRLFEMSSEKIYSLKDLGTPELPQAHTHFEKKYLNAGQSVYHLVFKSLA